MLFFGHIGITLGTAIVFRWLYLAARNPADNGKLVSAVSGPGSTANTQLVKKSRTLLPSTLYILAVLAGSMLPDIIDKPVGMVLFRETFSSGRIFSHTLLFLIVLSIAGLVVYKSFGKPWILALCYGCLFHLILDRMWLAPKTLFWPLFGFTFTRSSDVNIGNWINAMINGLVNNPAVLIPEIIGGLLIVALLIWYLVVRNTQKAV